MAVRFHFKTLFLTGILLGACGEDAPANENDDEQEQEESATADKKDSGAKADSGAKGDAGKKDDEVEDEDEDTDEEDVPKVDAGAPLGTDSGTKTDAGGAKSDAGGPQTDAGGTKADAGAGGSSCAELTYDTFGSDFIEMYCISCHAAQKPTLKDLASVVTNKAKIKAEAVTGKAMPPKGAMAPTDDERKKLGQWLDCGPK